MVPDNAGLTFKMPKRSAILFVDGSNFYHNSKPIIDESKRIDFNCLAKFICDKFDLKLNQVRYYNAVPDISENKKLIINTLNFWTS